MLTLLLLGIAALGWFSYFIVRDEVAFHKKMSAYWHERATTATDRWLSTVEAEAASWSSHPAPLAAAPGASRPAPRTDTEETTT